MNIARTLAKIRGNVPLHLFTVDEPPLAVDLKNAPDMSRDGDFLADRRRRDDRADLLRLAADGVLLVFLKHTVKTIGVNHALTRESDDQSAALRLL